MDRFLTYLSRFFDASERLQSYLSAKWRPHANERTVAVLVLAGALFGTGYVFAVSPPSDFPTGELFTIEDGASLSEAAVSLKAQRVVRSALAFRIATIIIGGERSIHAGDYLFKEPRSVLGIARAAAKGAFGLEPIRIRIPEGATTRSMATIFDRYLQRFEEGRFYSEAQPMEGYLFPDTYFFLPNATEETVIRAMRNNFDTQIVELQEDIEKSGRSLSDVVVMASLLEREARIYDDRRKIAGVLWNRIDRNMLLQVDAAFLYTIGKGTFQLTIDDLRSDDPYNTYVHKGLPPGPIGNPSLESIRAAIDPIESDNLYYLADRNGITYYSKTYEEHLRKKRIYLGT